MLSLAEHGKHIAPPSHAHLEGNNCLEASTESVIQGQFESAGQKNNHSARHLGRSGVREREKWQSVKSTEVLGLSY
jgi:hypothetical protein